MSPGAGGRGWFEARRRGSSHLTKQMAGSSHLAKQMDRWLGVVRGSLRSHLTKQMAGSSHLTKQMAGSSHLTKQGSGGSTLRPSGQYLRRRCGGGWLARVEV